MAMGYISMFFLKFDAFTVEELFENAGFCELCFEHGDKQDTKR